LGTNTISILCFKLAITVEKNSPIEENSLVEESNHVEENSYKILTVEPVYDGMIFSIFF